MRSRPAVHVLAAGLMLGGGPGAAAAAVAGAPVTLWAGLLGIFLMVAGVFVVRRGRALGQRPRHRA